MKFTKEITINASADKVWKVAGHDFADVGVWATAVSHSTPNSELACVNGSPIGGRVCQTSFGSASEEFTDYDDKNRSYSFKGVFKSKMFHKVVSSMKVDEIDENTAKVKIVPELELTAIGVLMYPMIKMMISKATDGILEDLKYYVENGKPSPRKLAAMKK